MKLRKLSIRSHSIFGDLDFDFTINNLPANLIVLAGDNGVGKTTLLNFIYRTIQGEFDYLNENEAYKFEIEFEYNSKELNKILAAEPAYGVTLDFPYSRMANIGIINNKELRLLDVEGGFLKISTFDQNNYHHNSRFKCNAIAIKASSSFNVKKHELRNSNAIFNGGMQENSIEEEVEDLFIKLDYDDTFELRNWVIENPGLAPPDEIVNRRLKQFRNAFGRMIASKELYKVEDIGRGLQVLFKSKDGFTTINELSSGEKQIIFKGTYYLSKIKSNQTNIVFFDEPEMSLHPNWQKKIIPFYQDLSNGEECQMFVATHSPFIIHSQENEGKKVLVLKRNNEGNISLLKKPVFHNWTEEEIIKDAFDIDWSFSRKRVLFVEGRTDEIYIKSCIEVFGLNFPYEVCWIGRILQDGNEMFSGKNSLNQAQNFLLGHAHHFSGKYIFLYDCDSNKKEEIVNSYISIKCLQHNETNFVFKKGIENSFSEIIEIIPNLKADFYTSREQGDYGEDTGTKFEKMKFCNYICNELNKDKQKRIFSNLKSEIERLLS